MKIFALVELEQPENMDMNSYEFARTALGGTVVLFTATGYEGMQQEDEGNGETEVNALTGYFEGIQHSPSYEWGAIIYYGEGNLGDQFDWKGSIADAERYFYTEIPGINSYGGYNDKESDEYQETIAFHYYRPYADKPEETQEVIVYLSRMLTP